MRIEGPAALIGCLLGLNQLPAGCRVDNSGITHRCRQAEPLGTQEEEGCRPIFSVQEHRALCARTCGQFAASWCLSDRDTAGTTRCLLLPFFTVFFFGFHLHLSPTSLLPRPSLSHRRDETCLAGVPAGSVERDPSQNKTRGGTSPCNGVQIASQARSLLCRRFAVCDGGISLCGYCEL